MASIHYLLMKAHTLFNKKILSRAFSIGLSPGQPKVLEYLMDHDGSDQKTISDHCEIRPSTVGNILTGMEKAGLIERRQKDGNRRSLYVFLTEKGRSAATEMAEFFAEVEEMALRNLTPEELREFTRLLRKIIQNLETENKEI